MNRNARFQSLPLHIFRDPSKGALSPLSARRTPINRRSVSSTLLHLSLKFPGKTIPLPGFPKGPYWSEVSVIYVTKSPMNKVYRYNKISFSSQSPW